MKLTKVWMKIRDSFWLVPTLYSISALLLVVIFHTTDEWVLTAQPRQLPDILIIEKEIARGLYTSLVTAILTMTTISFSVIMVVLTTYSSQFSPRTLQDFMQSRMTHHVLGVFCFGFIFALVNLLLMGEHDTMIGPIVMVVIAIICLAFFIYFIHHSAKRLQVSSLIKFIHADSARVIRKLNEHKAYGEHESWSSEDVEQIERLSHRNLLATNAGYIQKFEWKEIVDWATKNNCVIQLQQQIGDYVTKDLPIARIYGLENTKKIIELREWIIIGNERTDLEDIDFNIQKLVEIAVKAVSPSVNDPDTATNCINRIGSVLSDLGKGWKEIRYLSDDNNTLCIMKQCKRYEDYLYKSFHLILYYGKEDVSVCYSLLEVLYKMMVASQDASIRRKLWTFHFYIVDAINWDALQDLDRNHLDSIYQQLKQASE